jgi:DNA processing protein
MVYIIVKISMYLMDREKLSLLALSFVPGIGCKTGRTLLQHYKQAEAVFKAPLKEIKAIGGLSEEDCKKIRDKQYFKKAEEELAYTDRNQISILPFNHELYPQRLNNCNDAPLLLFYKGAANLNVKKTVAIVGTRKHTDYGMKLCEELIDGLVVYDDLLVVSGLAWGIDAIAHKLCVAGGLPTVGVLGHGMDRMYPPENKALSEAMHEKGGVLTEFVSGTIPDRFNFPMRNRIVAGMADVTIVVESDISGGAMITAYLASGYNKEVAAFPGRIHDSRSSGCNELIRKNIASLIGKPDDLLELMNWKGSKKAKAVQQQLFLHLNPDEQLIVDLLSKKELIHSDELLHTSGLSNSALAATLLQLEMQGLVKTMPGKNYKLS